MLLLRAEPGRNKVSEDTKCIRKPTLSCETVDDEGVRDLIRHHVDRYGTNAEHRFDCVASFRLWAALRGVVEGISFRSGHVRGSNASFESYPVSCGDRGSFLP